MTSHDMTSRNQPHHLTSPHLTSQPITLNHLTSTSPRNQPHDIIPYHITSQNITSPPPTHHGNTTSHHQSNTPVVCSDVCMRCFQIQVLLGSLLQYFDHTIRNAWENMASKQANKNITNQTHHSSKKQQEGKVLERSGRSYQARLAQSKDAACTEDSPV